MIPFPSFPLFHGTQPQYSWVYTGRYRVFCILKSHRVYRLQKRMLRRFRERSGEKVGTRPPLASTSGSLRKGDSQHWYATVCGGGGEVVEVGWRMGWEWGFSTVTTRPVLGLHGADSVSAALTALSPLSFVVWPTIRRHFCSSCSFLRRESSFCSFRTCRLRSILRWIWKSPSSSLDGEPRGDEIRMQIWARRSIWRRSYQGLSWHRQVIVIDDEGNVPEFSGFWNTSEHRLRYRDWSVLRRWLIEIGVTFVMVRCNNDSVTFRRSGKILISCVRDHAKELSSIFATVGCVPSLSSTNTQVVGSKAS